MAQIRNNLHYSISICGNRHTICLCSEKFIPGRKNISRNLELIFVSLLKQKSLSHISGKTNLFLIQKYYCKPDLWTCLEEIVSCVCPESEMFSFGHAKFLRTHFFRRVNGPKKLKNVIVRATIKIAGATNLNCFFSHLLVT